uniref:GAG-pre-integrase domain-containing protein n=1 Tax=Tanacetum cinerariifolium TaxID=118510 RepID=A0A6L2KCR8_TANCI|nr:hypothetical protein [Tanacetum cinerariifolium]
MCEDAIQNEQNDVESDDERVALANLISNLKLDVDENKNIQKQLKKANTTLAQELKECKTILAETSKSLGESISVRDSCLVALQNKQTEFEKYKAFNDHTIDYDKLEQIVDNAWIKHSKAQFHALTAQDMEILIQTCLMPLAIKTQNDSFIFVHELKQEMHADLKYVESFEKVIDELESDKAEFSNMYDMILCRTSNVNAVCATCKKCLVDSDHFVYVTKMLNDVNARTKKPNGVPISTRKPKGHANKSVATPHKKKLASKSNNPKPQNYFRMLQFKAVVQFVEKFLGTVRFGNDQFMPILGYGDLVQGKITINRVYYVKGLNHNLVGQFCDADLEVAFWKSTCFVRDLQAWLWHQRLSHLNFDYINLLSKKDVVIGLLKLKYVKDQLCSSCELSKAKRSSLKSKAVPSSKGRLTLLHMDLCGPMRVASINGKKYILQMHMFHHNKSWIFYFGPLYDEFFNASSNPQDIQTSKIQPASAPFTLTYVHAEENNVNQAEEEHLPDDEFTNPFCVPAQEVAESSSHNIGNLNVLTFNQPQVFKYRWTKNHPLEQVYGNPSRPVQTRR